MTYLTRIDAAKFLTDGGLRIAASTLAKLAVTGGGPSYRIWNGRAAYESDGLQEWAQGRLGPEVRNSAQHKKQNTSFEQDLSRKEVQ